MRLLSADEASIYLGIPKATLAKMRWAGKGCRFVKLGRRSTIGRPTWTNGSPPTSDHLPANSSGPSPQPAAQARVGASTLATSSAAAGGERYLLMCTSKQRARQPSGIHLNRFAPRLRQAKRQHG
jgi:hypothetical protein